MNKSKIIPYIIFLVAFVAAWNLVDYIYMTFITKSGYSFGIAGNIIVPMVIALVTGYFCILKDKKKDK